MKKNYLLMTILTLLCINVMNGQAPKFYLDFEGNEPLSNLPEGVENVNGANTVLVKGTNSFAPIPNAVQADPDAEGQQELFLDFHGYLRMDLDTPSSFSIAYDYRRNDDNDDWWLGFITFVGLDGTNHRLEQFLIRQWDGQLHYDGNETSGSPISFNTNYHIVLTSFEGGIKAYVDGVEVLNVPFNANNGKNIHEWTDASLLLSFKGNSYDGTTITPEPEFAQNARDTRVFVDNISLFDRELSQEEVTLLFTNGNNFLSNTQNEIANISVYPNPVGESGIVSFSNPEANNVTIFNVLGVEVSRQELTNTNFNVQSLATGSYFVKFFDAQGQQIGVSKLIKQ
jgi:hypothetical protein